MWRRSHRMTDAVMLSPRGMGRYPVKAGASEAVFIEGAEIRAHAHQHPPPVEKVFSGSEEAIAMG